MDTPAPPPPPPPLPSSSTPIHQLQQSTACVSTEHSTIPVAADPKSTVEDPLPPSKPDKRRKKSAVKDGPTSSSCASSSSSTQKGTRMALKRRSNPKIRLGAVRRDEGGDMEAIALPLGMSFAAVVAQVLERKDAAGDKISVDHLSRICTSAVRESLTNVFGDKFDFFARNFEKSFGTTLRTLTLIHESSNIEDIDTSTLEVTSDGNGCTRFSDINICPSEIESATIATQDVSTMHEEVQERLAMNCFNKELVLHGQNHQLACASSSTLSSVMNQSMLSTMEKSLTEQIRSNDLKSLELGLVMKKLKLKETQLALNHDLNHLQRSKLAMGISKASFKAEKFKTQLEAELLKTCIDCLVAGIVTMSASLSYAAYVHSYKKITEATGACTPSQESKSWWIPNTVSSFQSGFNTIKCQFQVVSRMLFGILMIITIAYSLLQRSSISSRQTMPITFILLLLGFVCGFAGKLCVDTLGGSGYLWLLYWESLCLVHFFANVWTSMLFRILHGPVSVSQGTKDNTVVPYWMRRSLFYATMLMFLPLVCGLLPFASLGEWLDHFTALVLNYQSSTSDWDEL